jgi:gas vesicle protein
MDLPLTILTVTGVIIGAGATTAYFARGRGTETIKLLQNNIDAYKDSEKLKDQRIAYLEGQLVMKLE